jgi:hypothetical protein
MKSPFCDSKSGLEVEAHAWDIVEPQHQHLILDEPGRIFSKPLKCVIVGVNKGGTSDECQIHYVVLVSQSDDDAEQDVCERVGVAFLEKGQIALSGSATKARIR